MQINLRALKAVNLFASSDEIRYYLKGVFIEPRLGTVTMVATDGRIMSAVQTKTSDEPIANNIIVPASLINKVKLKKASDMAEMTFEGRRVSIEYMGESYSADVVNGSFPNWRAVLPKKGEASGKPARFDFALMGRIAKAMTLLHVGGTIPNVVYNGKEVTLVDWIGNEPDMTGFALIMPTNKDFEAFNLPEWTKLA